MESYTSLVGTDRAVHLHSVASVYLDLAFVIKPWDSEDDDSFRFHDSFKDLLFHKVRVLYDVWGYTFENLTYGLMEFLFVRILGGKFRHEPVSIFLSESVHIRIYLFVHK